MFDLPSGQNMVSEVLLSFWTVGLSSEVVFMTGLIDS